MGHSVVAVGPGPGPGSGSGSGSGWGDTVVADVGLGGEAELLPVGVDRAAERASFGGRWVRRTEHLAAEVLPRELRRVPLDEVVVDGGARLGELLAHGHVEAVDHEYARLLRRLQRRAVQHVGRERDAAGERDRLDGAPAGEAAEHLGAC